MRSVLLVIFLCFLPLALGVGLVLLQRRWQARQGRRLPITAKLLNGPGEQLRKMIENEDDEIVSGLLVLVLVVPYFLAVWALQHVEPAQLRFGLREGFFLLTASIMVVWGIRKVLVHGKRRRQMNEGLIAELFTAQELNRLMGQGCQVFHDVPGEGFNLDHVVIGPSAVYLVETKSFRKPPRGAGADHFKVGYDGSQLRFPDFFTSEPIEQASRQAAWLSQYLQRSLGRSVPVVATVALPGWWIEFGKARNAPEVRVFNPSGKGAAFMAETRGAALESSFRALICQALSLRYPEAKASP